MKWLPIETAPKDGTSILLFDVDETYGGPPEGYALLVGYSFGEVAGEDYWQVACSPATLHNPTHWMPLPPPPTD
jgi:hypothetical protein